MIEYIIVGAVVLLAVYFTARKLARQYNAKEPGCGCGCQGCAAASRNGCAGRDQ